MSGIDCGGRGFLFKQVHIKDSDFQLMTLLMNLIARLAVGSGWIGVAHRAQTIRGFRLGQVFQMRFNPLPV
jgi:hypothetical protein